MSQRLKKREDCSCKMVCHTSTHRKSHSWQQSFPHSFPSMDILFAEWQKKSHKSATSPYMFCGEINPLLHRFMSRNPQCKSNFQLYLMCSEDYLGANVLFYTPDNVKSWYWSLENWKSFDVAVHQHFQFSFSYKIVTHRRWYSKF